jgi:hypothetical protein
MEYPAPCHSIREIEKIPKLAVTLGLAEIVKEEGQESDRIFTRVYHILVKDEIMPVNVRFWYDYAVYDCPIVLDEIGQEDEYEWAWCQHG